MTAALRNREKERQKERSQQLGGGKKMANHLEATLTLQLALAIIDTKQ